MIEAASSAPIAGRPRWPARIVATLGHAALGPLIWLAAAAGIAGGVIWQGLRPVSWRRPVRAEFVRFVELAGVQSLPAVAVAGGLVGIALVAQGLYWLEQLGEEGLIVTVLEVVLVREVAPLVVGLLVIGRGGLLLLGELAAMQRDGHYRALDAQGVDPFVALIMPRVLALAVCVFCLTIVFIVVAFLSGYAAASLVDRAAASPAELVGNMLRSIGGAGYFLIPAKTLCIGIVIGAVCCLTALERDDSAADGGDPRPRGFMRAVLAVLLVSGLVSVL